MGAATPWGRQYLPRKLPRNFCFGFLNRNPTNQLTRRPRPAPLFNNLPAPLFSTSSTANATRSAVPHLRALRAQPRSSPHLRASRGSHLRALPGAAPTCVPTCVRPCRRGGGQNLGKKRWRTEPRNRAAANGRAPGRLWKFWWACTCLKNFYRSQGSQPWRRQEGPGRWHPHLSTVWSHRRGPILTQKMMFFCIKNVDFLYTRGPPRMPAPSQNV